jgi:hypothetical protein
MGRHERVTIDTEPTPEPGPAVSREPSPEPGPEPTPEPGPRSAPLAPPDAAPEAMLGWGVFATLLAGVLAGLVGHGWASAAPVLGLGAGGTAVLWAAARAARGPVRPHARTRGAGHRSGTSRGRSVKWPRDQRKR